MATADELNSSTECVTSAFAHNPPPSILAACSYLVFIMQSGFAMVSYFYYSPMATPGVRSLHSLLVQPLLGCPRPKQPWSTAAAPGSSFYEN